MSRRAALSGVEVQASTHPGLWLDKYLTESDAPQKAIVIREAAEVRLREGYEAAYRRRREVFAEGGAQCFEAQAEGRVAIGLGAKGVVENGITLEHTWGVPILPGSALKGLAAAAARKLVGGHDWSEAGESYRELFGTTEASGCVDFHDAWWKPEGPSGLAPDVMTVHHAKYYAGEGVAPSDFDSPTPIPFCTSKGTFLIVLDGEPAWCEAARVLLRLGLEHLGVGAKTNAGYGRMSIAESDAERQAREVREGEARAREAAERTAKETREAARNLVAQLKGPGNMADVLSRLARARDAGLAAEDLGALALALAEKDRRGWKDWRARENRTPGEQGDFDVLLAPHVVAQPVAAGGGAASAASAASAPARSLETREVKAWAQRDSRRRTEIHVEDDGGSPYKGQAVTMDAAVLERLECAAKESPVACLAHYEGRKLKKLSLREE